MHAHIQMTEIGQHMKAVVACVDIEGFGKLHT